MPGCYRCRDDPGHGDPAGDAGQPLLRRERAQRGRAPPAVARHEVHGRVGRRRQLAAELQGVQRRRDRPGRRRQQRHLVACDQAGALRAVLEPAELPGRSVDHPLHTARSRGQRDVLDLVRRPRGVAEGLRRRPQGRVQRRRAAVVAGRRWRPTAAAATHADSDPHAADIPYCRRKPGPDVPPGLRQQRREPRDPRRVLQGRLAGPGLLHEAPEVRTGSLPRPAGLRARPARRADRFHDPEPARPLRGRVRPPQPAAVQLSAGGGPRRGRRTRSCSASGASRSSRTRTRLPLDAPRRQPLRPGPNWTAARTCSCA